MWIATIAGLVFGAALSFAGVNRYDTISGMAVMKDWTVAKTMGLAIGVGAIMVALPVETGLASYHPKALLMGGVIWGGVLFGFGMAVLGYCPGTMAISAGQGSLDAVVGIVGGLIGGLVFTLLQPALVPVLGPDLGPQSVENSLGGTGPGYNAFILVFSVVVVLSVLAVHRAGRSTDKRWVVTGVLLALLNAVLVLDLVSGRLIGASTAFPYIADAVTGATDNDYFRSIAPHGWWEMWFLLGSLIAGALYAVVTKTFEVRLIHDRWREYKGDSHRKRMAWAFVGGFALLFGARMAGGCTSGHILSGGMQLAKSSIVFAAFVFIAFLLTGKLFYGKPLPTHHSGPAPA
jgi:hypothetical protein